MPEHDELRMTELRCVDCGREFRGRALFKVHTVDDRTEPVGVTFGRSETACPQCSSRRVEQNA